MFNKDSFFMEIVLPVVIISAIVGLAWNFTAYRDLSYIRENAPSYLQNLGYEVLGTDGFTGSFTYGAKVWYQAKRIDTPNLIYTIAVVEWKGELQSYQPSVINSNLILNNN